MKDSLYLILSHVENVMKDYDSLLKYPIIRLNIFVKAINLK